MRHNPYALKNCGNLVDIDGIGLVTRKPEQHRRVSAMALTSGTQRSEHLGKDARDRSHNSLLGQSKGEHACRAHRPHRM